MDYEDGEDTNTETTLAISSVAGVMLVLFCMIVIIMGCVERQERRLEELENKNE